MVRPSVKSRRTVITGCVSDFAATGDASSTASLTIDDLRQFAERLAGMRLTYDHQHPAHRGSDAAHVTVGEVTRAWVDDADDSLYVDVALDDDERGSAIAAEVESKFLTGFSLGIDNQMLLAPSGDSTHRKDLIEVSITPKPEFANARITGVRHISASSADDRDPATQRRAAELLARLLRTAAAPSDSAISQNAAAVARTQAGRAIRIVSASSAGEKTNAASEKSGPTGALRATAADSTLPPHQHTQSYTPIEMDSQEQQQQQQQQAPGAQAAQAANPFVSASASVLDRTMAQILAAQAAQEEAKRQRAIGAGNTWSQQPARNGSTPVVIHNHLGAPVDQQQKHAPVSAMAEDAQSAAGTWRQPARHLRTRGGMQANEFMPSDPRANATGMTPLAAATMQQQQQQQQQAHMQAAVQQQQQQQQQQLSQSLSATEAEARYGKADIEQIVEAYLAGKRKEQAAPEQAGMATDSGSSAATEKADDGKSELERENAELRKQLAAARAKKSATRATVESIGAKLATNAESDAARNTRAELDHTEAMQHLQSIAANGMDEDDAEGADSIVRKFTAEIEEAKGLNKRLLDLQRQVLEARHAAGDDAASQAALEKLVAQKRELEREYNEKSRDLLQRQQQAVSRINTSNSRHTPDVILGDFAAWQVSLHDRGADAARAGHNLGGGGTSGYSLTLSILFPVEAQGAHQRPRGGAQVRRPGVGVVVRLAVVARVGPVRDGAPEARGAGGAVPSGRARGDCQEPRRPQRGDARRGAVRRQEARVARARHSGVAAGGAGQRRGAEQGACAVQHLRKARRTAGAAAGGRRADRPHGHLRRLRPAHHDAGRQDLQGVDVQRADRSAVHRGRRRLVAGRQRALHGPTGRVPTEVAPAQRGRRATLAARRPHLDPQGRVPHRQRGVHRLDPAQRRSGADHRSLARRRGRPGAAQVHAAVELGARLRRPEVLGAADARVATRRGQLKRPRAVKLLFSLFFTRAGAAGRRRRGLCSSVPRSRSPTATTMKNCFWSPDRVRLPLKPNSRSSWWGHTMSGIVKIFSSTDEVFCGFVHEVVCGMVCASVTFFRATLPLSSDAGEQFRDSDGVFAMHRHLLGFAQLGSDNVAYFQNCVQDLAKTVDATQALVATASAQTPHEKERTILHSVARILAHIGALERGGALTMQPYWIAAQNPEEVAQQGSASTRKRTRSDARDVWRVSSLDTAKVVEQSWRDFVVAVHDTLDGFDKLSKTGRRWLSFARRCVAEIDAGSPPSPSAQVLLSAQKFIEPTRPSLRAHGSPRDIDELPTFRAGSERRPTPTPIALLERQCKADVRFASAFGADWRVGAACSRLAQDELSGRLSLLHCQQSDSDCSAYHLIGKLCQTSVDRALMWADREKRLAASRPDVATGLLSAHKFDAVADICEQLVAHQFAVRDELVRRSGGTKIADDFVVRAVHVGAAAANDGERDAFYLTNQPLLLSLAGIAYNFVEARLIVVPRSASIVAERCCDAALAATPAGQVAERALLANLARVLCLLVTGRVYDDALETIADADSVEMRAALASLPRWHSLREGERLAPEFLALVARLARGTLRSAAEAQRLVRTAMRGHRRSLAPPIVRAAGLLDSRGINQREMLLSRAEKSGTQAYAHAVMRRLVFGDVFRGEASGQVLRVRSRIGPLERLAFFAKADGSGETDRARLEAELAYAHSSTFGAWCVLFDMLRMKTDCSLPDVAYFGEPGYGIGVTRRAMADALLEYAQHTGALLVYDRQRALLELRPHRRTPALGEPACAACISDGRQLPPRTPGRPGARCALRELEHAAARRALLFFAMRATGSSFVIGPMALASAIGLAYDAEAMARARWTCGDALGDALGLDNDDDDEGAARVPTYVKSVADRYAGAYADFKGRWDGEVHERFFCFARGIDSAFEPQIRADALSAIVNGATLCALFGDSAGATDDDDGELDPVHLAAALICSMNFDNVPHPQAEEPLADLRRYFAGALECEADEYVTIRHSAERATVQFHERWHTMASEIMAEMRATARSKGAKQVELPRRERTFCRALDRLADAAATLRSQTYMVRYVLDMATCVEPEEACRNMHAIFELLTADAHIPRLLTRRGRRIAASDAFGKLLVANKRAFEGDATLAHDHFSDFWAPRLTLDFDHNAQLGRLATEFAAPPGMQIDVVSRHRPLPFGDFDAPLATVSTCERKITVSPLHSYGRFVQHMNLLMRNRAQFSNS